jgi:rRNA maturation endonuclease Nob1
MPETAVAQAGAPCRGCGRPYHWLDLSPTGFCQRCGLAILRRLIPPDDPVLEVVAELVSDA